jgi:hypothetical protein
VTYSFLRIFLHPRRGWTLTEKGRIFFALRIVILLISKLIYLSKKIFYLFIYNNRQSKVLNCGMLILVLRCSRLPILVLCCSRMPTSCPCCSRLPILVLCCSRFRGLSWAAVPTFLSLHSLTTPSHSCILCPVPCFSSYSPAPPRQSVLCCRCCPADGASSGRANRTWRSLSSPSSSCTCSATPFASTSGSWSCF